jgi:ATP-dependent Clp protease adaptor protein ClpS
MSETEVIKKENTKNKIKEPKKYRVIVLNDDITPMEFVVALLINVFNHDEAEAVNLTMMIHQEGSAVAGTYSYEIAEQKGIEATELARSDGFPLQFKIEQE